jgi:hypothetical protein
VAGAAGVASLTLVGLALAPPEHLVRYLSDDAFYYFRIATHVVAGDGPTFDGLTPTTGFHPLYVLLLAAGCHWLALGDAGMVAFALGLGITAFLATGALVGRASAALWDRPTGWLATGLWYSNPHAIVLVGTGMEGALSAALLAGLLAALAGRPGSAGLARTAEGEARPCDWIHLAASALLAGLCVLARTDTAIVLPLLGLWWWLRFPARPAQRATAVAAFLALAALPLGAWLGYVASQNGDLLSGSARMKVLWRAMDLADAGPLGGLVLGSKILLGWLGKSVLKVPALKWVLPLVGQAVASARQRAGPPAAWLVLSAILVPALLGALYAVLLPRVWTWYYAPSLVLLTVLAAGSVRVGALGMAHGRLARATARALPILLALVVLESYGYLAVKMLVGRTSEAPDRLATAVWMREHLPADAVIGAWNAGIYGWYAGRTVVNLDGLVNDEIAPIVRRDAGLQPAWRPYWIRRGLTHLVDDGGLVARLRPGDRERLRRLYERPPRTPRSRPVTVYEVGP